MVVPDACFDRVEPALRRRDLARDRGGCGAQFACFGLDRDLFPRAFDLLPIL